MPTTVLPPLTTTDDHVCKFCKPQNDERFCDCGHPWAQHDTFKDGFGRVRVLCCHTDSGRFCPCTRDVITKTGDAE